MCGRYVRATPLPDIVDAFAVDEVRLAEDVVGSWNVAPTDRVLAVAERGGRRLLGAFRWGLVPSWAKDASGAARAINARAETLAEKPSFRDAFARRRCLLPADGFYEWRPGFGGAKQPVFVHPADGHPWAFAGLWESWRDPAAPRDAAPLRTCAVVTTTANGALRAVHERMPVILPRGAWDTWLDPSVHDLRLLASLLRPAPDDAVAVRPVSMRVNDVRNDGADLVEPVPA